MNASPPATIPGRKLLAGFVTWTAIILALMCLGLTGLLLSVKDVRQDPEGNAHGLSIAMFQYSLDHDGRYPTGSSSTEVCQLLIDQGYVGDPALFYLPLPGKTRWVSGRLKPENVCWDVTADLGPADPDTVPAIFMTGYKVTYVPGSAAVPRLKPHPPYGPLVIHPTMRSGAGLRLWGPLTSLLLTQYPTRKPGLAVSYPSCLSRYLELDAISDTVPGFIDASFTVPAGKVYRQLTPEGALTAGRPASP